MKTNTIKRIIKSEAAFTFGVVLLFIVVVFGSVLGIAHIDHTRYKKAWNDGICPVCGGEYEFEQAIGHGYATYYLYECSDCGHRVEVDRDYGNK